MKGRDRGFPSRSEVKDTYILEAETAKFVKSGRNRDPQ